MVNIFNCVTEGKHNSFQKIAVFEESRERDGKSSTVSNILFVKNWYIYLTALGLRQCAGSSLHHADLLSWCTHTSCALWAQ